MRTLLLAAALLAPNAAHAARGAQVAPWFLQVSHTQRDSRVSLGWQLRWQGIEILETPRALASGVGSMLFAPESTFVGMLSGARFNFYGVRLRPFRPAQDAATDAGSQASASTASQASKQGLRLVPLEDLRAQGERDLRRWLLTTAFDQILPQARSAEAWRKEAVARDAAASARLELTEFLP